MQSRRWMLWRYQPEDNPSSRVLYALFVAMTLLALIPAVIESIAYLARSRELKRERLTLGHRKLDSVADQVTRLRQRMERLTIQLAKDLETGALKPEAVSARLKVDCEKEPRLLSMGVAFRPHAYSPRQRLFAPFFETRTGKIKQVEEVLDYSDLSAFPEARWHLEPVLKQAPAWTVGLGGPAREAYLQYAVPFRAQGRIRGTVHALVSLRTLTHLLNKEHVGRLGSGFLLGEDGLLLAHPLTEHLDGERTLVDIARALEDSALISLAEKLHEPVEAVFELPGSSADQEMLCFLRPVPESKWTVGMMVYKEELSGFDRALRRRQIRLAVYVLFFLTGLLGLAMRAYQLRPGRLWSLTTCFSLLALGVLVFIWSLALSRSARERRETLTADTVSETTLIDDQESLRPIIEQSKRQAESRGDKEPMVIPTGILITAIEPQGGTEVSVSGLIWQRYHTRDHKGVTRGVVLPGVAPDPEGVTIEQSFTRQEGEHEVIGWSFRAVLRLDLDFSQYPFDYQQLGLRLRHPDLAEHVLLVPDLDSYERISSNHKPGLSREIVLNGWKIEGSYFTFETISPGTTFGLKEAARDERAPELQFNVLTRREITTPLLSHVFPIVVVAALLYGTLINSSGNEQRNTVSGFSTFGVLETCGAFFFAIVLVHIDLRSKLQTDVITYLESMHLILYAQLLLVAINVMLFTSNKPLKLLSYHENLAAKLLYWPVALGLTLAVTVLFFY